MRRHPEAEGLVYVPGYSVTVNWQSSEKIRHGGSRINNPPAYLPCVQQHGDNGNAGINDFGLNKCRTSSCKLCSNCSSAYALYLLNFARTPGNCQPTLRSTEYRRLRLVRCGFWSDFQLLSTLPNSIDSVLKDVGACCVRYMSANSR